MPGGGAGKLALIVAAGALALGAAACGDDSNNGSNPPPPPAAFGQVHDWGGGNTVSVANPRDVALPGLVKSGTQNVMALDVTVHNGGGQPVALNSYAPTVTINDKPVNGVALGGFNTAQVPANGTAQFTEVVEAPVAGGKVDVAVAGVNDSARPSVTFEGQSPAPSS